MTRIFPGVKPLRSSVIGFVAANDPAKIDRWIGNPSLHIGDQSAPAPGVSRVDRVDSRARAGSTGKIAADIVPKAGVKKGVVPGGIVWLGIGAGATRFARVGSPLTPGLRYFAQRDRGGAPVSFREEQRKADRRDGRVRGNRSEIERDQPATQTGSGCPAREKINAVAIAEETLAVFIERVVLLRRQSNYVGKRGAAQNGENQKGRERLLCLHQAQAAELEVALIQVVRFHHSHARRIADTADDGSVNPRR